MSAQSDAIPSSFSSPGAGRFWLAVFFTGLATGIGAILLTRLLMVVEAFVWNGTGTDLLRAAEQATPQRHVVVLLCGGLVVGLGQVILKQLTSANGIETTAAIWFHAGRLPAVRTLRQRCAVDPGCCHGCVIGARGCTETGRSRFRELLLRQNGFVG